MMATSALLTFALLEKKARELIKIIENFWTPSQSWGKPGSQDKPCQPDRENAQLIVDTFVVLEIVKAFAIKNKKEAHSETCSGTKFIHYSKVS